MDNIKLFDSKKIRSNWDAEVEKWYFSIVDIIGVLTDSPNPRKYWSVLKTRLNAEGSQLATNCSQLKMESADGKLNLTDAADTEQLLRLIHFTEKPKASLALTLRQNAGRNNNHWRRATHRASTRHQLSMAGAAA